MSLPSSMADFVPGVITLFEERSIVFASVFGLWTLFIIIIFLRVAPWLRMRKISLSRRRQFQWDSNSVSLQSSEAIAITTKPRKTT